MLEPIATAPVDPAAIPQRTLYTGAIMPAIGLGTFGSDHVSAAEIAEVVKGAAAAGYRHFDCASVYGNEAEIGASFEEILRGGIKREDLWITSKLWNDKHGEDDVIASCRQSLSDLRLDYLDLYLVHWPFPNFHPPRLRRYLALSRRQALHPRKLHEDLAQDGRTGGHGPGAAHRHLEHDHPQTEARSARRPHQARGERNGTAPAFPAAGACSNSCVENGMQPVGYCPIGSPGRPERDRTPDDTAPTEDPVIVRIAERHGIHPAVVCIKWAVQRGQTPIPFSVHHYRANLEGVVGDPLTGEEMRSIAAIDRNCRLIKGQVFLWKEGQTWEDLWDVNGEITPP